MNLRFLSILAALCLFLPQVAEASVPLSVPFDAIETREATNAQGTPQPVTEFSVKGTPLVTLEGDYAALFDAHTAYVQYPNRLQRTLGSLLLKKGTPQPLLCNSLAMDARCFDCPTCIPHRATFETLAKKKTPSLRYVFVASSKEMTPEGAPDAEGFHHAVRMTFTNAEANLSLTLLREKRFQGTDFPASPFLSKLNLFAAEGEDKIYACPSPRLGGDCLLCSDCQAKRDQLKPFAK